MRKGRVMIVAGGTGGHIFPALAVARLLQQNGCELQWLGSRVGMEAKLVGEEFPLVFVSARALRGKKITAKFSAALGLCRSTWQAWRAIKKFNPDLLLGMGGFVSAPGGLAALFARKPLVVHEQNAVAGMTNRFLSKWAKVILQGFPGAFPPRIKAKTVGNPVRLSIAKIPPPEIRMKDRTGPLRLLVLGGSRGASALNEAVVSFLAAHVTSIQVVVWHQTGETDYRRMERVYESIQVERTLQPFIHNIEAAYAWADLLICRAGALTVSELAMVGIPSILVPFPYAVDDHQYHNGQYLSKIGAAVVLRENELSAETLKDGIEQLVGVDRSRQMKTAMAAKEVARPEALAHIVAVCQKLINREIA